MEVLSFLIRTALTSAAQYPGTPQTKNSNVRVMEAFLMPMEKELKDLLRLHFIDMKPELIMEIY
jgi:hypothetical protein